AKNLRPLLPPRPCPFPRRRRTRFGPGNRQVVRRTPRRAHRSGERGRQRQRFPHRAAGALGRAASSSWISPSLPSDGGEGWGEEVRFYWFPLSSVLSPLVPRGERMESLMQPWRVRPSAPMVLQLSLCYRSDVCTYLKKL